MVVHLFRAERARGGSSAVSGEFLFNGFYFSGALVDFGRERVVVASFQLYSATWWHIVIIRALFQVRSVRGLSMSAWGCVMERAG